MKQYFEKCLYVFFLYATFLFPENISLIYILSSKSVIFFVNEKSTAQIKIENSDKYYMGFQLLRNRPNGWDEL